MTERVRAGELIDGTIRLLVRHPAALVLPLAPFGMVYFLIEAMFVRGPDEALGILVAFAGGALVIPAVTRAAFMPLLGEGDPRFGPAFAAVAPVRPVAALTVLVSLVAILFGTLALIAPGVLVAAFLAPVSAILVAEGLGPAKSVSRARELARGRYVALVGATLVAVAIAFAFVVLAELPRDTSSSFGLADFFEAVVLGFGFAAAVAFWATLSAVFYASVVVGAHAPTIPAQDGSSGAPVVAPPREPPATALTEPVAAGEATAPSTTRPPDQLKGA